MTNKEFIELSKTEVKALNGNKTEAAQEAWRAGYNYARKLVDKYLNTYYMDECITKLEDFSGGYLEEFEWNID